MQSLWMLLASFLFAIMGVCVKLADPLYSTSELVMYRGLAGVLILLGLSRLGGRTLRTRFAVQHAWRGIIGIVSLWLWFYSFGKLPLATAVTLNYMAPVWLAAILLVGGRHGDSRFEWGLATAIAASFTGVTLLLRPSIGADQWQGSAAGLASGMVAAVAYLQVRRLGQLGEPEYRVVFYFSLTGFLAGALGCAAGALLPGQGPSPAFAWHAHTPTGIVLLLGMGISAAAAQMALTRAYRTGKVLVTSNLQYTGIVFSSVWGILVFHDALDPLGWLGIAIILVSGSAATYYNARNAKAAAARLAESATQTLKDRSKPL